VKTRVKNSKLSSAGRLLPASALRLLLLVAPLSLSHGQEQGAASGAKDRLNLKNEFALFESEELLDVSLEFDLKTFLRKHPKTGYQQAVLAIRISDTDTVARKVRIRPRGQYRREVCSFPPVMVNFKKQLPAYSDTGKINKLKLVTHCQPGKISDENVLREYLVYKLYNVLTDTSFRVRLLRMSYIDAARTRKTIEQYGFFIEPDEIMALRTGSALVKSASLTQKMIVPSNMDRVAIFFYMISQWDWSVPGLHNIAVIIPPGHASSGKGITVPYDFDLTGIVNPSYGFPDEKMGISSNRDRLYSGLCRTREEFIHALEEFRVLKENFYSVVNDFPYLDQRAKKDITGFLDQFFSQLNTPREMERLVQQFMKTCKPL
jgi:hypothetical protein